MILKAIKTFDFMLKVPSKNVLDSNRNYAEQFFFFLMLFFFISDQILKLIFHSIIRSEINYAR